MKSSKVSEYGATCCVDICKAATFVSKTDMSVLRYIVPEIETELKVQLIIHFNVQEAVLPMFTYWLPCVCVCVCVCVVGRFFLLPLYHI